MAIQGKNSTALSNELSHFKESFLRVVANPNFDFSELGNHDDDFIELLQEAHSRYIDKKKSKKRLEALITTLIDYSRFEFSLEAPISEHGDEIDAIALGLNTLGQEIKYYKEGLEESNLALQMAQRIGRVGTWIYREKDGGAELSKVLLEIYGHPEKLFKDFQSFIEISHPDDKYLLIAAVKKARKDHKPFTITHRAYTEKGKLIYLESRGEVVVSNNQVHSIQGSTLDITEMVERQKELIRLNNLLADSKKSLENAQRIGGIGSWYWNIETNTVQWSDTLYAIYELPKSTQVDLEVFKKHLHPEDSEILTNAIEKCMTTGESYFVEHRIIDGNGNIKWLEARGEPMYADGKLIALTGTGHEVTKLMEQKHGLEKLAKTLEKKVAHRTEELEAFTYSVSHDLRAPIRAISGFSEILQEEYVKDLGDEPNRLINIVKKNTEKMSSLIDNLLSFSRVSKLAPEFERIDLNILLENCWKSTGNSHSDIDKYKYQQCKLPVINGNAGLLEQVFNNILDNAIKYSSKNDEPTIKVDCIKNDEEIVIKISDNGIGFNMDLKDKLFAVFQRLHNDEDFVGVGVGLAMVKRILDLHHARIWAESIPNKETSFNIAFPYSSIHVD